MLHNYESDDTRLGLGRFANETNANDYVADAGNGEFTHFDDVTGDPGTDSTYSVPASAIRTLTLPNTSPIMLPALNHATGAASCVDCTTPASATAPATAAATAAAVVTPMAQAPTTVNWLLIAMGLGLGYALLKGGPSSGLGCAPEPVPAVQENLGRPPRKPKAGLRHVENLEL